MSSGIFQYKTLRSLFSLQYTSEIDFGWRSSGNTDCTLSRRTCQQSLSFTHSLSYQHTVKSTCVSGEREPFVLHFLLLVNLLKAHQVVKFGFKSSSYLPHFSFSTLLLSFFLSETNVCFSFLMLTCAWFLPMIIMKSWTSPQWKAYKTNNTIRRNADRHTDASPLAAMNKFSLTSMETSHFRCTWTIQHVLLLIFNHLYKNPVILKIIILSSLDDCHIHFRFYICESSDFMFGKQVLGNLFKYWLQDCQNGS